MPGKGRPFVRGDPRGRPGPGRPKKAYLDAMRSLAHGEGDDPSAIEVIKHHLRRNSLQAAQDVLNRAYGKPKENIDMGNGTQLRIVIDRGRDKDVPGRSPDTSRHDAHNGPKPRGSNGVFGGAAGPGVPR